MLFYVLQSPGELVYEGVHHLLSHAERREQPEDIRASAPGEAMFFEDEFPSDFLVRYVEYHAYHQSAASHLGDVAVLLLQFLESGYEILARLMGILYKMLAFEDIEHGKCCRASEVIATEGCTELPIYRLEIRRYQHATHREAAAYALGHRYEVGTDAQPLVCEKLTATAISALYLIANEECAILLAGGMESLGKLRSNHIASAYALYGFYDAGAHIALGEFLLPSTDIIDGQIGHVAVIVYRCYDFWIVCCFYSE